LTYSPIIVDSKNNNKRRLYESRLSGNERQKCPGVLSFRSRRPDHDDGGNIPEGSEEQVRQAIEELTRERFGDKVQGSSVERNDVQKDRFDITVVMGPYANQHQFETATRHIIRFMENELGSQRAAFSTVN
jgi:hypothetical protein